MSKISKPFLFALIGILVLGIPLTLYSLLHQQIFQQFAWTTEESAVTQCTNGSAVIAVTFSNTESAKDMNVTATDQQSGVSVDLGTVKAQEQKSANIVTGKNSLAKGFVIFKLTWTDGSAGTDQAGASYNAINDCPSQPNICPVTPQGTCEWDPLPGAKGYNVVVTETDNGNIVQSVSVSSSTTQVAFPMPADTPFVCNVTPTNECGVGAPTNSPEKTCTVPTPTISESPTPSTEASPSATPTPEVSVSPTPTQTVSPTPTSAPSPTDTPVPTATPMPTATPVPTATPKPLPTPTPVVIVTILTPPPQQIVITSPPQQTIIRVPGQTNTIVQQGPPQTIVVQQPQAPLPTARPFSPVTPVPTVMATGNTTPSFIIAGTSAILLIAGGIIFFLL